MFNGRAEAQKLDEIIRKEAAKNPPKKRLHIILVGDNESSKKYVDLKVKLCEKLDISVDSTMLEESLSDEQIFKKTATICEDKSVGGVIIQLPLPRKDLDGILNLIPVEKDVDLISPKSTERFYKNDFSKLSPVIRAFKYYADCFDINLKNIDAVVIGKGFLVGEPLGHYLLQQGAKVQFILDYKTNTVLNCQLVVASAGSPGLLKGESLPEGCNVVDFGSAVVDGHTIGDFDLKSTISHLGKISPSPGGMGPLVTRYLIMNFLGI